jgi:uncharacterized protein
MVIDMHVHPGFYEEICEDAEDIKFRKKAMGWDLMSKFPVELTRTQMKFAGVDKLVLLPLDLTTQMEGCVVTNEEIRKMMNIAPDLFYGFASVDPYRKDAIEVLEYAFKDLKLMGLKLNPSKQAFYPADAIMDKIYEKCIEYNKPIMFHSGMSWEPNCLMKYSQPLNFEEVALKYPELRFCLAHFGWPWIYDTTALVLKYPNIYTDTSMLYMDSPEIFLNEVLTKQLGSLWIENNIKDKVMFGSNNPRFRTARIKRGLDSIDWRPATKAKILGGNAVKFLGLEE